MENVEPELQFRRQVEAHEDAADDPRAGAARTGRSARQAWRRSPCPARRVRSGGRRYVAGPIAQALHGPAQAIQSLTPPLPPRRSTVPSRSPTAASVWPATVVSRATAGDAGHLAPPSHPPWSTACRNLPRTALHARAETASSGASPPATSAGIPREGLPFSMCPPLPHRRSATRESKSAAVRPLTGGSMRIWMCGARIQFRPTPALMVQQGCSAVLTRVSQRRRWLVRLGHREWLGALPTSSWLDTWW